VPALWGGGARGGQHALPAAGREGGRAGGGGGGAGREGGREGGKRGKGGKLVVLSREI
jgi:hypothetical protein